MCGIVGIVGAQDPAWLTKMNSLIDHRGPDDWGEYRDATTKVALGMRRLSILDLTGGHQPMSNEDGTVWIVFNGEIYNAPELRPRLEELGHRFATTNSDTEILLHLYEEKGRQMLHDLNGMFAFVIYDQSRGLLFAARDRMGIKPLYYWQGEGRFVFASELKSLLVLPFVEREIDRQSLFHYMTLLYVPDAASIIKNVYRLPAGHSLVYNLHRKQLELHCYWRPEFDKVEQRSVDEWVELLRVGLQEAMQRWILSDVPLACSLSGGLDSSAIVGLLAQLGQPKIRTYSLGFAGNKEQSWNELDQARQVAQQWDTEHHEIILEPEELLQDLVQMVWHLDEPYAGGLPAWYVFREISREVKVGLTGTGGDELFGNYGKFQIYESNSLVRMALAWRRWAGRSADIVAQLIVPVAVLSNRLPDSWPWIGRGRVLSGLPNILSQPFGRYYYANSLYMSDVLKRASVFESQNETWQDTATYLQQLYDANRVSDVRSGLAAVDFRTQLAEEFLFMTDRFSMAHSLEVRTPFLDHQLVETVFRIPASIRTKSNDLKYLFKQAVADLLPPELLTAPKRGFVIPIELWLRRELRPLTEYLLNPQRLQSQGIFQPMFYDRFVLPHLEGQATFTWQVWAALMFQLWYTIFFEQRHISAPTYDWQGLTQ